MLQPLVSWEDSLLQAAEDEDHARLERFKRSWCAYYGKYPDQLQVDGRFDDNVKGNPARFLVSTGASFLFGQQPCFIGPELPDKPGETEEQEEPEWLKTLNKIWGYNNKKTLLNKLAINGGVCGHVFAKILPVGRGPDRKFPRIVILDPANVKVRWNPEDVEEVWEYVIQYTSLDTFSNPPSAVVHRQRISNRGSYWTIVNEEQRGLQGSWRQIGPEEIHPYTWPPIVDCQNLPVPNDYWGMADLEEDVLDIIERMQYVDSNTNKIIRLYAHPKTWTQGMTPDAVAEIDVSPDGIITLPDPDAKLNLLELSSDLGSSLNFGRRLRSVFNEMVQTPQIVTGELEGSAGALSGINLSIMFAPIVQKTQSKQGTYGDMLVELSRRLLALSSTGGEDPWELDIRVSWGDVLPGSQFIQRQTLLIDKQIGASTDTLLEKLGYDPTIENQNNAQDAAAKLALDQQAQLAKQPVQTGGNVNPGGSMNGVQPQKVVPTTTTPPKSIPPTNARTGQ